MKTTQLLPFFALFFLPAWMMAQPENDECVNAFHIDTPVNWCSSEGQFTTFEATADTNFDPSCLEPSDDVWFSFTTVAPSLSISVLGGFFSNQLSQPQIGLYSGACGQLNEVGCQTGNGLSLQAIETGLELGQTYYLEVQGLIPGSFVLCINNYSGDIAAVSDCPDAVVLCNQDPFVIPQVLNAGNDPNEANDAPCLNIAGLPVESFSTWFVWTAAEDGDLTFSLNPINATDDLDFVLYEFPNGPGDCSGKIVRRCMASSCPGATGLNDTALDNAEPPGCGPGQDNFLSALQMEEGRTYGLMVNNFSQTTIGFEVEFGGTSSFFGGENRLAAEADQVCQDSLLSFTGLNPPGSATVIDWQWEFGVGATPSVASGPGPHEVAFSNSGTQYVLLRAITEQGCTSSEILPVEVVCCADNFIVTPTVTAPSCPGNADGAVSLDILSPHGPPFFITWEDGADDNPRLGLESGFYNVTITDTTECQTSRVIEVPPSAPFTIDTLLSLPSCDAGMDGIITLDVTGPAPPFEFAWGGTPFTASNTLENLPAGLYSVAIRDAVGCIDTLAINLQELQLVLDPQVTSIVPPSCFGATDGQIALVIANGLPPYQFDFNDGNGYVASNALEQLAAGSYLVNVLDANLCEGQFNIQLEAPAPVNPNLLSTTISCFGFEDGILTAVPEGGTPPYALVWEDGSTTSNRENLAPGTYTITVTDANGCQGTASYEMAEPGAIIGAVDSLAGPACFGDQNGLISVKVTGGQPPFVYKLSGLPAQDNPLFPNLASGFYTVTVTDSRNCANVFEVTLPAPEELVLDIFRQPNVKLGYNGQINQTSNAINPSYSWSPPTFLSCTDCANPEIIQPTAPATYFLELTDENGCSITDSVQMGLVFEYPAYLPNAFSPNDDGINDSWAPLGGPALENWLKLQVFDRWGGLIYEAQNPNGQNTVLEWDGNSTNKRLPIGVYTCIVEGLFIDGRILQFQADVLLTR